MGLIDRFETLMKADAHGVLDAVEDRTLLLRQHLRDAEAALSVKRARLDALDAEARGLASETKRLEKTLKRLEEDIRLALEGGKDDLARFAIRKRIPLDRRRGRIDQRIEQSASERRELAESLLEQEESLRELKDEVRAFTQREEARARGEDQGIWVEPVVTDEDVEIELMRLKSPSGKKGAKP